MFKQLYRFSIALFLSLSAFSGLCAPSISLYPKAEVLDIPLLTLSPEDSFVQAAISRGPDARGWCSGVYQGPWMGFVQSSSLQPSRQKLKPGSLVYSMPSTTSIVLTRIDAKDDVQIEPEPASDWTNITLKKPIWLYFRMPAAQAASNEKKEANSNDLIALPRDLQGRFSTCSEEFMGKRYDYQLLNSKGDCVALLDISRCVFAADLHSYLNQEVIVQGLIRELGRYRIVEAVHIRLP